MAYVLWENIDIIDLKDTLKSSETPAKPTCKADIYEDGAEVYMIRLDTKEKIVMSTNKVSHPVKNKGGKIIFDLSGLKKSEKDDLKG